MVKTLYTELLLAFYRVSNKGLLGCIQGVWTTAHVRISTSLYIYLFIYLSIHPSIYPSVCLSTYMYVYLSIYLSTYLSIFIYLAGLGPIRIAAGRKAVDLGSGLDPPATARCPKDPYLWSQGLKRIWGHIQRIYKASFHIWEYFLIVYLVAVFILSTRYRWLGSCTSMLIWGLSRKLNIWNNV